jgi:ferredoxin
VNLVLLPLADPSGEFVSAVPRLYEGSFLIGLVFLAAILLNFVIPRFYCRIICPLGALFGLLSRFALWRIGRTGTACTGCDLCITACEGGCEPAAKIRISDCLLCFNCTDGKCKRNLLSYGTRESVAGEVRGPDMGRRQLLVTLGSAALVVPMMRVTGSLATNWHHQLVRPPGSLPEPDFLEHCIKCGQCMRICPTNVIVPAGLDTGLESLWTPVLDFRNGTSGCQLNCTACGNWCPTAAIRPLSLEERMGVKQYADNGPIRMGTAFVDRGRCLPWAMDTPCIVCQENCPVTPKAIVVKEMYNPVRFGVFAVTDAEGNLVSVSGPTMKPGQYATGDFYATFSGSKKRYRITENTENSFSISGHLDLKENSRLQVLVRLQAPYVDIAKCVGCGVCEHECPVSGLRAIRITAENETRNVRNSLMLERSQG